MRKISFISSVLLGILCSMPSFAVIQGDWVRFSAGEMPANAIPADSQREPDKRSQYICRAAHNKGIHPGKFIPNERGCVITVAGRGNRATHYEILTWKVGYSWQRYVSDELPEHRIIGGAEDADRQRLEFICRVREGRRWQLGKIRSPIEGCKLSINRRAKNFRTFEVLVGTPKQLEKPLAPVHIFDRPTQQKYHLAYCLQAGFDCGKKVADTWCQQQSYQQAQTWKRITHIAGVSTKRLDNKGFCDGRERQCEGFEQITCIGKGEKKASATTNFTGNWRIVSQSKSYNMRLKQTDKTLIGRFEPGKGHLRGVVKHNKAWGRWRDKHHSGRFVFQLNVDGTLLGKRDFKDETMPIEIWRSQR